MVPFSYDKYTCAVFLLLVLYMNIDRTFCTSIECENMRNKGCCDGYFWNKGNETCEKCTPGYVGPDCGIPCPYPSYGERCQGHCNCINISCDVSTGCKTMTTAGFVWKIGKFELKNKDTNSLVVEGSMISKEDTTILKNGKSMSGASGNLIEIMVTGYFCTSAHASSSKLIIDC